MNARLSKLYAIGCTLLLLAGLITAFFFAWGLGVNAMIACIVGVVVSLIVAPIIHELGHIAFAQRANMQVVYAKFFCFRLFDKDGKLRFGFAPAGAKTGNTWLLAWRDRQARSR